MQVCGRQRKCWRTTASRTLSSSGWVHLPSLRAHDGDTCVLILDLPHACRNKSVCEVGAGLGLAGLVAATHLSCASVLITDGNDKAAQSAYPPVPCVVRLCVISPTHQMQILLAAWNTTPFSRRAEGSCAARSCCGIVNARSLTVTAPISTWSSPLIGTFPLEPDENQRAPSPSSS